MGSLANVTQVGLDNHSKFGSVCCRDASGRIIQRRRLDYYDRHMMRKQHAALPKGTPVAVEGTFGWSWVCEVPHGRISRWGHGKSAFIQ